MSVGEGGGGEGGWSIGKVASLVQWHLVTCLILVVGPA